MFMFFLMFVIDQTVHVQRLCIEYHLKRIGKTAKPAIYSNYMQHISI